MKKIIHGKKYDTKTATVIGESGNGLGYRDFNWCEETLYRKKTGEFFLHGEGGPASAYAEHVASGGWTSGETIVPLTIDEAKEWAEDNLSADDYEKIFGEVEE